MLPHCHFYYFTGLTQRSFIWTFPVNVSAVSTLSASVAASHFSLPFDNLYKKQEVLLLLCRLFALNYQWRLQVWSNLVKLIMFWSTYYACAHSQLRMCMLGWLCAILTEPHGFDGFVCFNGHKQKHRKINPCCSPYGHLNQDGSKQMDGPVDTNPLYEVMELDCVCALLPCHSWLTDWPT